MAFPKYDATTLRERFKLALDLTRPDTQAFQLEAATSLAGKPRVHDIPFPDGLAPVLQPINPSPAPDDPLPRADVVAMMDTVDEAAAMADVLTPGVDSTAWYPYTRLFKEHYLPLIAPTGPSRTSHRLGSYFLVKINGVLVLCYKTELHLHTDAKKMAGGSYSLPIKDMFKQIIDEVQPKVFLTTGTSGGVYTTMHLGDVVVTRAAAFHCQKDFKSAPFNNQTYTSTWNIPTKYRNAAGPLMQQYAGKLDDSAPAALMEDRAGSDTEANARMMEMTGRELGIPAADLRAMAAASPPSSDCGCSPPGHPTQIFYDGQGGIPAFHPILTTDYFEFGTSVNRLDELGVAVEMDDAVLGLVCSEMANPPQWASIRNLSDPTINGALPEPTQRSCAGYYYTHFGYWTTVMSALTTWSIVAGLA